MVRTPFGSGGLFPGDSPDDPVRQVDAYYVNHGDANYFISISSGKGFDDPDYQSTQKLVIASWKWK